MPDEEVEAVRLVEERLIVGSTAVDRIEVEPRGAEVDQGIRVIVALEFRRRIEREVVVDELSEVGDPRRDVGIVASRVLVTRFRLGLHHLLGECGEGRARGKERRKISKHAPEPALEKRRPEDGFLTSDCMPMERFGCQGIHLVLAVAASLGARRKRSPRPGGLSSRSASGDQTRARLPAPRPPYPGDPYLMASGQLAAIAKIIRPRPFRERVPDGGVPRWRATSRSRRAFAPSDVVAARLPLTTPDRPIPPPRGT